MKKLTKRVQAGGLWFDVPLNTMYVAFDIVGFVMTFTEEPIPSSLTWKNEDLVIARIDLEGVVWRECCWYVGDQVDGESAERREWMARGVELTGIYLREWFSHEVESRSEDYANKIRSGEVD